MKMGPEQQQKGDEEEAIQQKKGPRDVIDVPWATCKFFLCCCHLLFTNENI
jgi:hypothetical protein